MRLPLIFLLILAPLGTAGLIPKPREITIEDGKLLVDVQTAVIAPAELTDHATILTAALQKTTGFLHRFRTPEQIGLMRLNRPIRLALENISGKPGFYRLKITPQGVSITATDRIGLMHGAQTFANLLPVSKKPLQRAFIPAQTIEDWPQTARRIFHLDVGAHLYSTGQLKTLIDWLSFHKINELHLQLNNDHGWRMQCLKLPKLHELGSIRSSTPPYGDRLGSDSTEYGGYYTQENLRNLVTHAHSRAVTIVPSFSLTTGASSIIASYPDLGKTPVKVANTWEPRQVSILDNQSSHDFLDTLFKETADVFSASEIRIEGPETELHQKIRSLLAKHNRTLLIPSQFATTDLSLYPRPAESELLLAPKLEAEGGFNPVSLVYQLKPKPAGAQATLRTQFAHSFDKLQYLAFPRLAAFAEATWLPSTRLKYDDFRTRLKAFDPRYRLARVTASIAYDPPVSKTLHGTKVTTTIDTRNDHSPELVFDGNRDSFFWSAGGLKKGDQLTLEFPWPATGQVTVATGTAGTDTAILEEGLLELSGDGLIWHTTEPLIAGRADVEITKPTRFLRLRATSPQLTSLILSEIILSEPLLAPLHEETRMLQLPLTKEEINLTFKADFNDHPNLRDEILEARKIYFTEWLPLARKIGVSHLPNTSRSFEIKAGEPGEISSLQIREWTTARMINQLQNYPASAPLWFTSGFSAFLQKDIPKKDSKSKPLAGGPASAAFLQWLEQSYGDSIITSISIDCHRGAYRPAIWKSITQKSLDELVRDYQKAK